MNPRPRLLFVTDVFPFPFDRGQRIRVYNLLLACAKHYEVSFVGPAPQTEAQAQKLAGLCAHRHYVDAGSDADSGSDLGAWLHALRAAPGIRRPATVREYLRYARVLRSLKLDDYDCIWAERLPLSRLFGGSLAARTIVDLDDLEHVKLRRSLALQASPLAMLRGLYRYLLYRHGEVHASRRFRAALVCSDDDRRYLAERGCRNVAVVPNGTLIPEQLPARVVSPGPLRLVFLGNLGYPPNLDAVRHFADDILPVLNTRQADLRFDVIGPGADEAPVAALRDRVHFRGFVDDLSLAFAEYDLFVAPLRVGSGTKLKILDAMSRRLPVVTSSVGAEGLDLIDGQHALIANTPEAFADAILRLQSDAPLRERLANNAATLVRNRYGWDAINRDTARLLESLQLKDAATGAWSSGSRSG